MIRGSIVVAAVAILVSLLVHILGLSMTAPDKPTAPVAQGDSDVVDLSNSFEDLAEALANPVEPEAAEITEPEEAEVPTSNALVASENPEPVSAPDFGKAEIIQPDVIEPQDAEPADPSDNDHPTRADAENTQPEATDTIVEFPQAEPVAETEPIEAEVPPISNALIASENPEPDSASDFKEVEIVQPNVIEPQDADPSDSDQPASADAEATRLKATDTVAEILQGEPVAETDSTEAEVPTTPIITALKPEDEVESLVPEQAVTEPVRPRLLGRNRNESPEGAADSSDEFADLRFPQQLVESPLATFQRSGTDAFTSGDTQRQSGGRGPGNSNETNYAGLVLVHLNRSPPVYASAHGFARVFFQIDPDGSIAWVEITDSSGSTEIHRIAKQLVRKAAPFPPPPDGVSRKLSFNFRNR